MSTVEFTSDTVRSTRFREKLRGYHPEEVDAFLERAAAAFDQLQARLAEVTERALKAEAALESNSEADESIRRTLALAQRTAEMAVSEANEEAERLRTEADAECRRWREEADQVLEAARREAASVVAAAEAEAGERRREAEEALAARHDEFERSLAAQAEAARRDLDATIGSLTAQRYELRLHVQELNEYLAAERGRVIEALNGAVERFGATLTPGAQSALLGDALSASDAPVEGPAVPVVGDLPTEPVVVGGEATDAAEGDASDAFVAEDPSVPEGAASTEMTSPEGAEPTDDDAEPPAALLFTVEDDVRRPDPERVGDGGRGRRVLGRRRA